MGRSRTSDGAKQVTREEAVPGAVVVRLDRHGERMPGLYRIKDVMLVTVGAIELFGSGIEDDWFQIRMDRLRLATEEEKR